MKIFRTITISFLIIFLIIYLSFIFLLPNLLNQSKVSKIVEDNFFKQTGYKLNLNNPHISTTYNLNIISGVERADIFLNDKKIAQINNLKLNLSLLPLIFKTIKISNIKAEKLMIDIPKEIIMPKNNSSKLKVFEKLPSINIDYYRFTLFNNSDKYVLKGNNLSFNDNTILQKMNLIMKGNLLVNDKKMINYDLDVFFRPLTKNNTIINNDKIINLLKNIKKYSITSDVLIKADFSNLTNIKGQINISGLKFSCENKVFPASFANIILDKNNIKIKTDIFTSFNKKISIIGDYNYSAKKNIKLKINSDDLYLEDLFLIAKTITRSFGIKIFDNINIKGNIKANFDITSDLKTINSNGNINLKNTFISYNGYSIDEINSKIDFSKNNITIEKAQAFFKKNPIHISGKIDTSANADISIYTDKLNLKDFANKTMLKENIIDGYITFKAYLKGNLREAKPNITLVISQPFIRNKATKFSIKNNDIKINLQGQKGNIVSNNILISDDKNINSILIPRVYATINKDVIEFDKGTIWIDNVKADYLGRIVNIYKTPTLNNFRLIIPTQLNVKGPKKSQISINGDLFLNGNIKTIKIKGNVNISKLLIPEYLMTLKNIMISADENGIKINCPYIDIDSSIIRLNSLIENIFTNNIKYVNINADYIDLNKIKKIMKGNLYYPNINSGILKTNKILINDIVVENIVSDIVGKNNILYLKNLTADMYSGKISADISYDILKDKTIAKIQGRGIDSYNALIALSGKQQDIHGRCDFDSTIDFIGETQTQIQKSINGDVKFIINNFNSGNLGKLDYLIQAQNILSNRVLQASLNLVQSVLKIKDSGVYNYAQGNIKLDGGFANFNDIKLAGPSMSLYLSGRYYIPDNIGFILILGRVSDEIVSNLGPLGNVVKQSYIPKIGSLESAFLSDLTTTSDLNDLSKVPELTVKTNFKTQAFKVLINGDLDKSTSVKSFKWIKQDKFSNIYKDRKEEAVKKDLPDFIEKIPEFEQ